MTPAEIRRNWDARWPEAQALWSPFTRLSTPRWCSDSACNKREGLGDSFAMIRLTDQAIVLDLASIAQRGLEDFSLEIMGHEIGHHILCPGDLADQGRLLLRMRRALAERADDAPLIANLYADLLINDRLQRERGLRMADVYHALDDGRAQAPLWALYLRTCEILWSQARGRLARPGTHPSIEGDALLAARLVRVYAADWLHGATGFALLCLPYLFEQPPAGLGMAGWRDAVAPGGDSIPSGLSGLDPGEDETPLHPADDPALQDGDPTENTAEEDATPPEGVATLTGLKSHQHYRGPAEYETILRAMGNRLSSGDIAARYYRERALPWLVPFPGRPQPKTTDPLPEGLDPWELGDAFDAIDWTESLARNPHIIPGVTTQQRHWGESAGNDPAPRPFDLYIGIDCSGSMSDPRLSLSYPVLAGTIVALSALRAGASVISVSVPRPRLVRVPIGVATASSSAGSSDTGFTTALTLRSRRAGKAAPGTPFFTPMIASIK